MSGDFERTKTLTPVQVGVVKRYRQLLAEQRTYETMDEVYERIWREVGNAVDNERRELESARRRSM